jgi:hypothetical protein
MGKQGASEGIEPFPTLEAGHLLEGIKSPADPLPVQSLAAMRTMNPRRVKLLQHPEPAAMFVQEVDKTPYVLW